MWICFKQISSDGWLGHLQQFFVKDAEVSILNISANMFFLSL